MNKNIAAVLKTLFKELADGTYQHKGRHDFGSTVKAAIREGITTKEIAAELLGVEPPHLVKKANSLKGNEIRAFCQKLNLN